MFLGVTVGFEEVLYEGTEGDVVTVTVVLNTAADREIVVGLNIVGGTATGESGARR